MGGVLSFGETNEAAAIGITNRDERCSLVNLDPGSARPAAEVLKAIVRVRDNKAGVYGTVTRRGRLAVGQPIFFEPAVQHREHPVSVKVVAAWDRHHAASLGAPASSGLSLTTSILDQSLVFLAQRSGCRWRAFS